MRVRHDLETAVGPITVNMVFLIMLAAEVGGSEIVMVRTLSSSTGGKNCKQVEIKASAALLSQGKLRLPEGREVKDKHLKIENKIQNTNVLRLDNAKTIKT